MLFVSQCIHDDVFVMCSVGIEVRHSWGMTETSPIGTTCVIKVVHTLMIAKTIDVCFANMLMIRLGYVPCKSTPTR